MNEKASNDKEVRKKEKKDKVEKKDKEEKKHKVQKSKKNDDKIEKRKQNVFAQTHLSH